jgi:hypothetical protein
MSTGGWAGMEDGRGNRDKVKQSHTCSENGSSYREPLGLTCLVSRYAKSSSGSRNALIEPELPSDARL